MNIRPVVCDRDTGGDFMGIPITSGDELVVNASSGALVTRVVGNPIALGAWVLTWPTGSVNGGTILDGGWKNGLVWEKGVPRRSTGVPATVVPIGNTAISRETGICMFVSINGVALAGAPVTGCSIEEVVAGARASVDKLHRGNSVGKRASGALSVVPLEGIICVAGNCAVLGVSTSLGNAIFS